MTWVMETTNKLSDWHTWRNNGIGSSDASTIIGVNPYQCPERLLWEKVYKIPLTHENTAIKHGKNLEHFVRAFYNKQSNTNTIPLYGVHKHFDFLRASFDGVDKEKEIIIEIKCPMNPYHGVPVYYYVQLQHQMLVSGATTVDFIVYCKNKLYKHQVERNDKLVQELFEKELDFWKRVLYYRSLVEKQNI